MLEAWQATTTFHSILAIVLLCGGLFKDDFAKKLRVLGAVVLPLVFFSSLNTVTRFPLAFELMLVYGAAITSVAFGCWHFMKERLYLYAGLVNCLAGTGFGSVSLYRWLQKIASPEGVRAIVLGLGCFVVALFISAVKGGLFDRFRRHPEISSFDPPVADA